MTKHDDVRKILHESGFKFDDGRTALDMTDEEVDDFIIEFLARMTELGAQMQEAIHQFGIIIAKAVEPMQDLSVFLNEIERQRRNG